MAGERSSSALLYMIGQCDPIIIFQGHVSGRVLVVAPVWERPGSVEGGPWVFCLVPTVGPLLFFGRPESHGTHRQFAKHLALQYRRRG